MEKEVGNAIRDCDLYPAYQENPSVNMSSLSPKSHCQVTGSSRNKRYQQQQQPGNKHDCENKGCNTSWRSLGCIKLYELAIVKERRKFLKDKGLCFHCRRNFHGVRKPNDSRTARSRCNWTREMEPVKCHPQQGRCYTSAATCIFHLGQSNVSDDLRTWLTNSNIKNTLFTMY